MFLNKVKKIFFSDFFLDMSIAKKVAYLGIFLALSIAVNLFSIDVTPALKISFTYLLGFFAGTFFGPLAGFFILFTGDFLGILFTGLTYWLPTGINTGMLAFIPGAVMNWVKMTFKGGVYVKAVIACVLMYLLCTCGIGAVANYTYVKYVNSHYKFHKAP